MTRASATRRLPDIKPQTKVASFDRDRYAALSEHFLVSDVSPLVGMSDTFVKRVCGRKSTLSIQDVILLLDQDAFRETIVPRSMVLAYLLTNNAQSHYKQVDLSASGYSLILGNALNQISSLPPASVQCVVTSTPYWALRIYKEHVDVPWADGELCAYGHEQTPEGFVRHTTEILLALKSVLTPNGSIWWNIMDTFNTRTQIRGNAVEALRAMQGRDSRAWGDHESRRYSAGHSYLKDGEQCMIPSMIAERASRIGYYVKSTITWAKTATLPEPQESRVSRNLEYILHLSLARAPSFNKECYRTLPAAFGGRNNGWETDKLSDVWTLPTSSGGDGHGAQFPIALPGRCIALSTNEGELVLDPFVGAGTSGVAALALGRRFIGIDVSPDYLQTAQRRLKETKRLRPSDYKPSGAKMAAE